MKARVLDVVIEQERGRFYSRCESFVGAVASAGTWEALVSKLPVVLCSAFLALGERVGIYEVEGAMEGDGVVRFVVVPV